jgi:hypothetical protein
MLNHKNISRQEIAAEWVIQTAQEWQTAMDSVPTWIYSGKQHAASRPEESATFTIELAASGNVLSITS